MTLTTSGFHRLVRSIERTLREAAEELPDVEINTSLGRTKVATLSTQLDVTFKALNTRLDPYVCSDQLPDGITEEEVEETLNNFLAQYSNLKARCEVLLSGVPPVPPSPQAMSTRINVTAGNNTSFDTSLTLPKFKLPFFSGDNNEFDNFWTRFDTLVNQTNLPVIAKFEHLLDQLKGAAYNVVSHLEFKSENYESAIRLLKERYDNPRRSITLHANGLLNLPSVTCTSESIRAFLDKYNTHYFSLKNHSSKLHVQDIIFTQFVMSKFSYELRDKFETKYGSDLTDSPDVSSLINFLEKQALLLENVNIGCSVETASCAKSSKSHSSKKATSIKPAKYKASAKLQEMHSLASSSDSCVNCGTPGHNLVACPIFLSKTPQERFVIVKSKHLCTSCLVASHKGSCKPKQKCNICSSGGHNTLLHFGASKDQPQYPVVGSQKPHEAETPIETEDKNCLATQPPLTTVQEVLMATCLVKLSVSSTRYVIVRAILDSASHVSFITEHCAQLLRCSRYSSVNSIKGVGSVATSSKGLSRLDVSSLNGEVLNKDHPFVILNKITSNIPRANLPGDIRHKAQHLVLADPTFDVSSPIDCLLGADLTALALSGGVINLGKGLPVAVSTCFGYVLMGSVPEIKRSFLSVDSDYGNSEVSLATTCEDELSKLMQRFWINEEPPQCSQLSPEENHCEKLYTDTTIRLMNGRYQVRLPFKEDSKSIGNSYNFALKRLISLEHRFDRDPHFKKLYVQFMQDYIHQGHMVPISDQGPPKYVIPHHGIFKQRGDKSKIRVVFDASAKSSTGVSLNDVLHIGNKLQTLLSDVLTLFRCFRFVFTCDIEQMFRQITIHPEDQLYQCILWRESRDSPIQLFVLTTVTYGTASAPYLALRTLRQLAMDEFERYPSASQFLLRHSFVDDFLGGANTLTATLQLREEIVKLLDSAGFTLKKWSANHPDLFGNLPEPDKELISQPVAILGFNWSTLDDTLNYFIPDLASFHSDSITKRSVLSNTARLFDPCGWISPFVFKAKCFLQKLWHHSLDWDAPLPPSLQNEWIKFSTSLAGLNEVVVPRPLMITCQNIQLHGFSDASQLGYAAALYLRTGHGSDIKCRLIVSKTKVAPLKPVTIPRLELMGAHLLARVFHHYVTLLKPQFHIDSAYLWTDSTIVLEWVKTPPHLLKTFVANRVSQIIDWTSPYSWNHTAGVDNPADKASRGVSPSALASDHLWWHGPKFLQTDNGWPASSYQITHSPEDLEFKPPVTLLSRKEAPFLFEHFSSWSKMLGVMSYIIKWIHLCNHTTLTPFQQRQYAISVLLRHAQQTSSLKVDIKKIADDKPASRAVQRLNPFIDEVGVLRARGRLIHSTVYPGKSPVILAKDHHLVPLLIRHYHTWLGHAGPSQVQYQLSFSYWILSARQAVRKVVNDCVICFKTRPRPSNPLMGDLPGYRVNPAPPFYHTGMDFCGPFLVKHSTLRKAPVVKAYLCIFICMCVKAVHLEVALSLTAQEFIDCLKRFIGRRGIPHTLYSDCGTNFVGSKSLLQKEFKFLLANSDQSGLIKNYFSTNRINFIFSCPSAPHQGGLWERAVRSTKYHLKRIVGKHILTVHQFTTLTIQVESLLNSRPLTPLPSEPGDCEVLSPGHFLIGRPLTSLPSEDYSSIKLDSLRHYQLTQALFQRFWKKWRQEYLTTLQARSKWTFGNQNLKEGDLVLINEPNTPPLNWPMGRITQTYPGTDGVVRRAIVKTQTGQYERPAVKLFRLPIAAED